MFALGEERRKVKAMRLIDADNVVALVRDVRKNLPKDSSDFFTRDNMLLNFEQILNLEPTVGTMGSDVLKSVEEISGYTPEEMIAMYDDYERMAKEWEAYASAGLTPEVCAEYRKFEDEVVASGMTFGEVVELMHAEKDGRLVTLPCKAGDTVYYPYAGRVIPKRITQYREILRKSEAIDRWYCLEFSNDETFDADDIGKTVFLTRAEAEKSLGKERDEH